MCLTLPFPYQVGVPASSLALSGVTDSRPSSMPLYHSPNSLRWNVRGFGLDSTLPAGPGRDPATGPGVTNGAAFVRALGRHN
jgi:hypothetical protein